LPFEQLCHGCNPDIAEFGGTEVLPISKKSLDKNELSALVIWDKHGKVDPDETKGV